MIDQLVADRLIDGLVYGGVFCFMGFGCGLAIELIKMYGGIR